MGPKYEEDFYGWTMVNVSLLKQGKFKEIDVEHIIEEMEDMGKREKRELINRLCILITHLLKWHFQPQRKGRSWHGSIMSQRIDLKKHMRDNPSLKSFISEALSEAYEKSRYDFEAETGEDIKILPSTCPYTFEECLDDEFFPE